MVSVGAGGATGLDPTGSSKMRNEIGSSKLTSGLPTPEVVRRNQRVLLVPAH